MGEGIVKLTVFFEEPFWIGVFERYEDGKLSVAKVTFGAEPKDYDVYQFILNTIMVYNSALLWQLLRRRQKRIRRG